MAELDIRPAPTTATGPTAGPARVRVLVVGPDAAVVEAVAVEAVVPEVVGSFAEVGRLLRDAADGRADPVGVVVCDPALAGEELRTFLTALDALAPDACLVATGDPDLLPEQVRSLVEPRCFAFLPDPRRVRVTATTISSAARQYALLAAHRQALESTLPALIELFVESLALSNPLAYRRTTRMVMLVSAIAERAGVPLDWRLRVAAWVSQIGCFAVPVPVLDKIEKMIRLPYAERRLFDGHLILTSRLLEDIPMLEEVAVWVSGQFGPPGGAQASEAGALAGPAACFAAAAAFLDGYDAGRSSRDIGAALTASGRYPPTLVEAVLDAADVLSPKGTPQALPIGALTPGMVLAKDVRTADGVLLMRRGELVTSMLGDRLRNFASLLGMTGPVTVYVPGATAQPQPPGRAATGRTPARG